MEVEWTEVCREWVDWSIWRVNELKNAEGRWTEICGRWKDFVCKMS